VALAALLRGMPPEFQYVSLQKSVPDAERSGCPDDLEILDFAPDFNDTAALCECLDLIISVDTSIAHLGAALGTPTWILLRSSPDWRWFLDRLDSPWYPSVRLYRQPAAGDWQGVFEQVSRDLRRSYAVDGIGAEPAPRRAG
jgi:ADP-heptose:LPS heptosyltransferase